MGLISLKKSGWKYTLGGCKQEARSDPEEVGTGGEKRRQLEGTE